MRHEISLIEENLKLKNRASSGPGSPLQQTFGIDNIALDKVVRFG